MTCDLMLLHNGLDCSHEVLNVFRIMLRNLSSGRDETAWDIVDKFELALEFGVEIEADWAGRHFLERFLSSANLSVGESSASVKIRHVAKTYTR